MHLQVFYQTISKTVSIKVGTTLLLGFIFILSLCAIMITTGQVQAAPPSIPFMNVTNPISVTHNTLPKMSVSSVGTITNQFLDENGINQISTDSGTISNTTIAVRFGDSSTDPDVGTLGNFTNVSGGITLTDSAILSGFDEHTTTTYRKPGVYSIFQRTLAKTSKNCVIMELTITNISPNILVNGKLLVMLDIDAGGNMSGNISGNNSYPDLIYQQDSSSSSVMGMSILRGAILYNDTTHGHTSSTEASLRSHIKNLINGSSSSASNNLLSYVVADIGDLSSGENKNSAFGLCARNNSSSLITSFKEIVNLKVTQPITTKEPILASKYTDNDEIIVGQRITYTTRITNSGYYTAYDVVVTDTIFNQANLISVSSLPNSTVFGNKTITISEIAPGGFVSVTYVITPNTQPTNGGKIQSQIFVSNPADMVKTNLIEYNVINLIGRITSSQISVYPQPTNPAPINYTFRITNLGSLNNNVIAIVYLPNYISVFNNGGGVYDANTHSLTWDSSVLGSLVSGGSIVKIFTIEANQYLPTGVEDYPISLVVTNSTSVKHTDKSSVTADAYPKLKITKTDNKTVVDGKEQITYTLTIQNTGNQEATGIQLRDTLPTTIPFTYLGDSGTFNPDTKEVVWSNFNLPAGPTGKIEKSVIIRTSNIPPDAMAFTNKAMVVDDNSNGYNARDKTEDTDVIIATSNVSIAVITPSSSINGNFTVSLPNNGLYNNIKPNDTVLYTLQVKNKGTRDATGVKVTLDFGTYTSFLPVSQCDGFDPVTKIWTIGEVNVDGAPKNCNITIQIANLINIPPIIGNSATLTGVPVGSNQQSVVYFQVGSVPDLEITQNPSVPIIAVNQPITYTINVKNIGLAATNSIIKITDTLPANTNFITATTGCGSFLYNSISHEVVWTQSNSFKLQQNQTLSCKVVFTTPKTMPFNTQTMVNVVGVSADISETITSNNRTIVPEVTILAGSNFDISLKHDGTYLGPNQPLHYTIVVTNIGTQDATDVNLASYIDNHNFITYGGATESPFVKTLPNIKWTFALSANESLTLRIYSTITSELPEITLLTNTITLAHNNQVYSATDVASIIGDIDLQVEKIGYSPTVKLGDIVTYTLKVRNNGSTSVSQAIVTDFFGSHIKFISSSLEVKEISTNPDKVDWLINNLSKSQPATEIIVTAQIKEVVPAYWVTNTAQVRMVGQRTPIDSNSANNLSFYAHTISNPVLKPDLAIEISDYYNSSVITPENSIHAYRITVTNIGLAPAVEATVVYTLPLCTKQLGEIFDTTPCSTPKTYKWSIERLNPNDKTEKIVSFEIINTIPANVHWVTATAMVTAFGDEIFSNNNASYSYQVIGSPYVTITKKATPSESQKLKPGDTITYTLTIFNSGNQGAKNVLVFDKYPTAAMTLIEKSNGTTSTVLPDVITWDPFDLNSNEQKIIIVVAKILTDTVLRNITNIAEVKYNGVSQTDSAKNTIVPSVPVESVQIKGLTKGAFNTEQTFIATDLIPSNASLPIVYHWQATEQQIKEGETVRFNWPTIGRKIITLTVDNGQPVPTVVTHEIEIVEGSQIEIDGRENNLTYQDLGKNVTLHFPKDVVTESVTFLYIHKPSTNQLPIPSQGNNYDSLAFRVFRLEAHRPTTGNQSSHLPNILFSSQLITLSIEYNNPDGYGKERFKIFITPEIFGRQGTSDPWQDVAQVCNVAYDYSKTDSTTIPICQTGTFALFRQIEIPACDNQPQNSICVVDDQSPPQPISNTLVYQNLNGKPELVGKTDERGIITNVINIGPNNLIALQSIDITTTPKISHTLATMPNKGNFIYEVYRTNINFKENGDYTFNQATKEGNKHVLTFSSNNRPLILFNMVASMEWDANPAQFKDLEIAFKNASDYLFDVSDGQMALGWVTIYDNGEAKEAADIQILTQNTVRPEADTGGLQEPKQSIRVGRLWDGKSSQNPTGYWSKPEGYRTLIHEFGHYALHLRDEYIYTEFDNLGKVSGVRDAHCMNPDVKQTVALSNTNASIMYWQYNASELTNRLILEQSSQTPEKYCLKTEQYRINNGESDWETVHRYYSGQNIPWSVVMPTQVVPGPNQFPYQLPFPVVITHNKTTPANIDLDPKIYTLTVYKNTNEPIEGAWVLIEGIWLHQGSTNANGQIEIYGSRVNDILRIGTFDGVYSGKVEVREGSTGIAIVTPTNLITTNCQQISRARLTPVGRGDLAIEVIGLNPTQPRQNNKLLFFVYSGGNDASPLQTNLLLSPTTGNYTGTIPARDITIGNSRFGIVWANGNRQVGCDKFVYSSDVVQMQINPRYDSSIASKDSKFVIQIFSNTLLLGINAPPIYVAIGRVTNLPGLNKSLQKNLGDGYEVKTEATINIFDNPANVRLYFEDLGTIVNTKTHAIYYWREDLKLWEKKDSKLVSGGPFGNFFSTETKLPGLYAILTIPSKVYLPVMLKSVPQITTPTVIPTPTTPPSESR